jgi:hypothetical protein
MPVEERLAFVAAIHPDGAYAESEPPDHMVEKIECIGRVWRLQILSARIRVASSIAVYE